MLIINRIPDLSQRIEKIRCEEREVGMTTTRSQAFSHGSWLFLDWALKILPERRKVGESNVPHWRSNSKVSCNRRKSTSLCMLASSTNMKEELLIPLVPRKPGLSCRAISGHCWVHNRTTPGRNRSQGECVPEQNASFLHYTPHTLPTTYHTHTPWVFWSQHQGIVRTWARRSKSV